MPDVSFGWKVDGTVGILSVAGSVDAHNAPEFDKKMKEALGKTKKIILELSKLEYIATAGLGVLMAVFNEARGSGGNLVLAAMPAKIRKVFDTMGFSRVLKIAEAVDQAKSLM